MKFNKRLIAPMLGLASCMAIGVGTTYALFTSTDNVEIAVNAGRVKIAASAGNVVLHSAEANPTGTILDEFGNKYISKELDSTTTWTNGGKVTIGSAGATTVTLDRITPGDVVNFDILPKNFSSVAINYRFKAVAERGLDLYKALNISINGSCYANVQKIGEWIYVNAPIDAATAEAGVALDAIPVEIALPLTAGNGLQETSCSIKFILEAVQGNAVVRNESTKTLIDPVSAENVIDQSMTAAATVPEAYVAQEGVWVADTTVEEIANAASMLYISENNVKKEVEEKTSNSFRLSVEPTDVYETLTIAAGNSARTYDVSLYRNDGTKVEGNRYGEAGYEEFTVKLFIGAGLYDVNLWHYDALVEGADYEVETGYVTYTTDSFSPFSVTYRSEVTNIDETGEIEVLTPTGQNGVYISNKQTAPVYMDAQGNRLEKRMPWVALADNKVATQEAHNIYEIGSYASPVGSVSGLDAAFSFAAPADGLDAEFESYRHYHVDWEVAITKDGATEGDVILAKDSAGLWGYYESWGLEMGFLMPSDYEQGMPTVRLLKDVANINLSYEEVIQDVRTFDCGVFNLSASNKGVKLVVSLVMYPTVAIDNSYNNFECETGERIVLGSYTHSFAGVQSI